jgi:hypothetical protein
MDNAPDLNKKMEIITRDLLTTGHLEEIEAAAKLHILSY